MSRNGVFLTVHATTGAAIGTVVSNPLVALVFGILSHGILDIIPHGDEGIGATRPPAERFRLTVLLGLIDTVVLLVVLGLLLRPWQVVPLWSILAGVVGGVLPDGLQALHGFFPRVRLLARYTAFHEYVHVRIVPYECSLSVGMMVQGMTLVLCAFLLGMRT